LTEFDIMYTANVSKYLQNETLYAVS